MGGRRWTVGAGLVFGAFGLACVGTVEGERLANGGACPEGEVCVEGHEGLIFTGQVLYDEGLDRLGPILVGGTFQLAFTSLTGDLRSFDVVTERGLGVEAVVGGKVTLVSDAPGDAYVRVVDRASGRLYDRLLVEMVEIEDVALDNVEEPGREVLYAGCEEMIGVDLIAGGGTLRAFDQDVDVDAPGGVVADPFVWDCFRYVVPLDQSEVTFTIRAGDGTFVETRPVEPPPVEGCPERTTD